PTRLRCSACKTIEKRGFRFYPLKRVFIKRTDT
ncbi:ubiA prenyltransferase family protein, partial [Vibrio parahaemolyticus AQ3810]